ncbi:Hint domain-containing protein [Leisingera sp. MMG026]|uniref:Hint domain-containing protein n=1 Tax=Leisingera sp. MMG026 TaxID=2909982 RepID=UPI0031CC9D4E|nr:Hint domain-containing protein [Leisingera sp. MMG026]
MGWFGVFGSGHNWSDPQVLLTAGVSDSDGLLVRGTIMLEFQLPESARPEPLLLYSQCGDWPLRLALQAVPGGGLSFVLEQSGAVLHQTLNPTSLGRTGRLRLLYAWDAPARTGRLTLEQPDGSQMQIAALAGPKPWRLRDLQALTGPLGYVAPAVEYVAFSSCMEPAGPAPALLPSTPIATPEGYRALNGLQRGDLVLTSSGEAVPVLHVIERQVPALGSFAPVRLRAPYFGLLRDIQAAPFQRLVLSGSEVEYLFGQPAVLVPAGNLLGTGTALRGASATPLITYRQAVLPDHEPLLAAGAMTESLFLGRLRRDPPRLAASLLAPLGAAALPEHRQPKFPVLRAFDAAVLAERRTA